MNCWAKNCRCGKAVYFIPLADLIAQLAKAEREGTLREKIRFLTRASLLVVDEIGYLPVTPGGANLFFQLVNARYEKGAMILTSNRGFAEWGEVFGDPVVATALLDRLLHHAVVIQFGAPATACVNTQRSSPKTCATPPPSIRRRQSAVGDHPEKETPILNAADHRTIPNRQHRDFFGRPQLRKLRCPLTERGEVT